jgi:glycosyltransferase involved in cell wall biosynthesis
MKTLRYLALTFGDATCASTQFRIHAHIPGLAAHGIAIEAIPADEFHDWDSARGFDGVVVQKKLLRSGAVRRLRRSARRLVYDVDDAIWHPHGRPHHWLTQLRTTHRLKAIARAADLCLAANQVLARQLRTWARRVEVLPMCLDGSLWRPTPRPPTGRVRVGWAGAPGNLPYLEALEPALIAAAQAAPEVEWAVLCGRAPRFHRLQAEHVAWQPGLEPGVVATFDVGLLPLPDNPFAAAKSPIKGLQYLACGVPVVASPLEATRELFHETEAARWAVAPEDWTRHLVSLVRDTATRQALGRTSRQLFEQHYSLETAGRRLAELLRPS